MDEKKRNLDTDLDAGLEAAFGAPESTGASILHRIERLTGVKSQILLYDSPDEESPLTHVHRLTRDDEGAEDDSRYQVAGEIAKGGVGVVYKCRDRDLGRDVAVKVLRKVHAGNPEVFHRFVEEAQIGGQLQHPGIVPVYSLGLQPDGRPSFAMKLVKGRTLAAALKERKSPAEDRRTQLRIFERICQTMAYAHARGVIHRDLKPSNVMLGAFGEVLVVDWGFGKVLSRPEHDEPEAEKTVVTTVRSEHEGSASIAGSVMGTPAYMPPEQALGHVADLDEQTDVFSLGAILCEMLTGSPPYVGQAKDLLVLAGQAKLDDAYERLACSDADPEITALARRCLSPLRGDRPANANEVAEEMGRLLTQAEERAHAAELDAVQERSRVRQARHHAQWERRAKRLTIGIAAAVLVLIAGGGVFFFLQDARNRELTARARPKLEQAIEKVNLLSGQGKWEEALDQAERAEHLAADLDVATQDQVRQLVRKTVADKEEAHAEAEQSRKDRQLLTALGNLSLTSFGRNTGAADSDKAYADLFLRYGIDVATVNPTAMAKRIRNRGDRFATEVAAALDDWSWRIRDLIQAYGRTTAVYIPKSRIGVTSDPVRLGELAHACDPDSQLAHLRELFERRDVDGLVTLASREEVLDLPPGALVRLASALWAWDRNEERVALLQGALLRRPGDFRFHLCLAHTYSYRGDRQFEEAHRHYTAALAILPDCAGIHSSLGSLFLRRAPPDLELAEYHVMSAIHHDPKSLSAYTVLADLRMHQGRWAEAISAQREAVRIAPTIGVMHYNLARLLGCRGFVDEAVASYRESIRLHPENWTFHYRLGKTLFFWGRFEEAASAYRNALHLKPEEPGIYIQLGRALELIGLPQDAIEIYRDALGRDSEYPEAHGNIGLTLARMGRFSDALESIRRGHELGSKKPGWKYPSAQWLEHCERQVDLARRLPAILRGEDRLDDAKERFVFATVCHGRKLYAAAARFYAEAFDEDPTIEGTCFSRAAQAAVLAASGSESEPDPQWETDRGHYRGWALEWLKSYHDWLSGHSSPLVLAGSISIVLEDRVLAAVRDEAELEKLPEAERAAWQEFWKSLREALARAKEEI